jgi:predicted nuclease of predicted toxin-antitoxin system
MRIKLDENLSLSLASALSNLGHEVETVFDESLTGHSDPEIWLAAQRERRFLITQDLGFSDARAFAPGTHAGMLLLRRRSPDRVTLATRVRTIFEEEDVRSWTGCFVVASERKIRVLRPAKA